MLFSTAASNVPGTGILACECYDKKAQFSRIHAQYPLKFIPTQAHVDRLAVVYMLSYGGGIVSGDHFDVVVRVEANAMLLLMTQGNTKVFKDPRYQRTINHPSSEQVIQYQVAADATLLVLPDPVTSFQLASFASKQTFHLTSSSTSRLILLDWFTSGRMSRGESWAFQHYASKIDVMVDTKLVLRDQMVLHDNDNDNDNDTTATATSYAAQLAPYTCFATLIIVGVDACLASIERMGAEQRIMATTMTRQQPLLWSSNPLLKGRGTLVRVAGRTTEQVRDFIKNKCLGQGVRDIVGDGMFTKILI